MTFIWYPKCSTCKKMKDWLDSHNIQYNLRDIMTDTPTADELADWHKRSGLPFSRFCNSSGDMYRQLGLKDKLANMSLEEQYKIISQDGYLIRRPLLVSDHVVLVGSKIPEWEKALLQA